jgi:polysaccharide biosynthesis transport protein
MRRADVVMDDGRMDLLEAGWKEQSFGFDQMLGMVRRQIALVLAVMVAAFLLGAAYIVISPPLYTATASLYADIGSAAGTDAQAVFALDNHVELVQSDRTALAVIDELDLGSVFVSNLGLVGRTVADLRRRLGLDALEELPEDDQEEQLIRAVRSGLDVRRVGNTTIIEVRYTSLSRSLSAAIANAFATNYVKQLTFQAAVATERRVQRLEERAEEVKRKVHSANEAVQQLRSNGSFAVASAADLERRVAELRQRLTGDVADAAAIRAQLAVMPDLADGDPIPATALQTPEAVAINYKLVAALNTLTELEGQSDIPEATVAQIQTVVADLRRSLAEEVRRARQSLELDLAVTDARQLAIRNEIDEIWGYGRDADWTSFLEAQHESAFYEGIYRNYLVDLEQAQREPRGASVRVISAALSPATPIWPRYKVVLAIALTAGAFIGIGMALTREWARRAAGQSGA